ncbi:hypothetical protein BH24BAC1_BH24BAC1_23090 [soil metagenome]
MKTVSTITRNIKVLAATALLGAAPLFLSPGAQAQTSTATLTAVASSAPGLMASLYEMEPMRVRLHLANPAGSAVAVTVRDEQGQQVFKESFRATTFSRILDLSHTPAGTYTLLVANRQEEISRPFSVHASTDRITVAQELVHRPGSTLMAAMFEVEPQKVRVHLANPSGQQMQLVVRNEKREVVLRQKVTGQQATLILDLGQMVDGAYDIEVTNQSGQVSRTFETSTVASRTFAWEGSGTDTNTTAAK